MPTLSVTEFNIVCAVLGGFISLFGLVSYFVKERLYLSEALIAMLAGIVLGPHGANFIRPMHYAEDSESRLDSITLAFTRLVLGVQLVLAGVQLPKKYLWVEWRSLLMLLLPVMTAMWVVSSLLIWVMVTGMSLLYALAIAACITPTDPILSNTIVKGKFADKHIPVDLQRIIIAESGANDGLGYPFLFVALYFIKYCQVGEPFFSGGARSAIGQWFGETMGYTIILSVAYGTVVGWQAKNLLHWAESHKLVDRESFLVFAISLALFIVGTCGMLGTDDVLACFIAGNVFTLDDWFRIETEDDSLQPTIDMLLNISVFMWFGAIIPWDLFISTPAIPLPRLIALAVLILVLRRLPAILVLHRFIPRVESFKEALFTGFFGPMGVSAVFYLYITIEFLETLGPSGLDGSNTVVEEQINYLLAVVRPIVWICVLGSVIVHGITVPVMKIGNQLPVVLSNSRLPTVGNSFRRSFSTTSVAVDDDGTRRMPLGANRLHGLGSRMPVDAMTPYDVEAQGESSHTVPMVEVSGHDFVADMPTPAQASTSKAEVKVPPTPVTPGSPASPASPATPASPVGSPTLPNLSPRSIAVDRDLEAELERIARRREVRIVEAKRE